MINNRLDSALRLSPTWYPDHLLDQARKAIRLADYSRAAALLAEFQRHRDREAAEYYNLLGALCEGQKKRFRARRHYTRAKAMVNDYQPAKLNLNRRGRGLAILGDEHTGIFYAQLPTC